MGTQGDQAVAIAKTWLGVPYLYTGTTRNGIDCSALMQQVFKSMGINIPRTTDTQAVVGKAVANLASALPGDVCYFGPGGQVGSGTNGHCGMYIGGGQMIDAPHSGTVVRYDAVGAFTGQETLAAIRRFWDDTGLPVSAGGITDTGSTTPGQTADLTAAVSAGGHCALKINLPGSSLPIIGSSLSFCLWEDGWSRALLGGLIIAGGGIFLVLGAIVIGTHKVLSPFRQAGSQIAGVSRGVSQQFRTGA
jgi:hypothetical protein